MQNCSTDIHQTRYIAHQLKKKEQLAYSRGSGSHKQLEKDDFDSFKRVVQARRTQRIFKERFGGDLLCRAIALGNYSIKVKKTNRKDLILER